MRPLPETVEGLLEDLETHYPPRCKDPSESLEQHTNYAGQVQLIADLRVRYEWTRQEQRMESILNKGT